MLRRALIACLLVAAVGALLVAVVGYRNAIADPVVRRLVVRVAGYPADARPVRIFLLSDLHMHGPDMPSSRIGRIVEQAKALRPDIVVAADDFVGGNWVCSEIPIRMKADLKIACISGLVGESHSTSLFRLGKHEPKPGEFR